MLFHVFAWKLSCALEADMSLLHFNCMNLWLFLKQLSSLRSGHRRLTGSPTSEDQQSSSQPSPSGVTSNSLRSSSMDNKSESNKRTNKVNTHIIYKYIYLCDIILSDHFVSGMFVLLSLFRCSQVVKINRWTLWLLFHYAAPKTVATELISAASQWLQILNYGVYSIGISVQLCGLESLSGNAFALMKRYFMNSKQETFFSSFLFGLFSDFQSVQLQIYFVALWTPWRAI